MQEWLKRVYVLGIAFVAAFALFTSTQVASAHATVPAGCWQTSWSTGCNRCGFLWLKHHWWDKITWSCPNGVSGEGYESGPCETCN